MIAREGVVISIKPNIQTMIHSNILFTYLFTSQKYRRRGSGCLDVSLVRIDA